MDLVAEHERELTNYALERMKQVRDVVIYGPTELSQEKDRLGVISFNVDGVQHSKVAAILSWEAGIGVRNGCFCAHPYVIHLLGLTNREWRKHQTDIRNGDKTSVPGLVRISFGCYNTTAEIDVFIDMLKRISAGDYAGAYRQEVSSGDFIPVGSNGTFDEIFSLRTIIDSIGQME
jgi:cysteine desulfurase/selenocysteine lyase